MFLADLEKRVLDILDRVLVKQPVEGQHVELKTTWIDATKAARQIAGFCNALRGDRGLWIVGVDEERSAVLGATNREFSDWWSEVKSKFDGERPSVTTLPVPYDNKMVVALWFDSSRAPFVVRNPEHGKPNGNNIAFEVPWREANATRSATREDLIRILVPAVKKPELELIDARLITDLCSTPNTVSCQIILKFFAVVYSTTVLPAHWVTIECHPNQFAPRSSDRYEATFSGVRATESEVTLTGPGGFDLLFNGIMQGCGPLGYLPNEVDLRVEFGVVGSVVRPEMRARLLSFGSVTERNRVYALEKR
jgi:hypothetical protein